ncbi:MAG: UDP-N-acetylmuramate:L-alanyl-gamma-D-glutamyl-meso-diaminopimelate ligase [Proteobacteria bacterium]|nr:UDP-N-acetylmuramate:L-alanyl-gamma-D-glutamyl-meso-diaminopimelate ligase [Pseudomonadota bacterium]MBU1737610.1 UDP-N-acetylmuramate:L-alanyl-gamma-D-glutamyl-meso-diaminopimelate ligase [Pseudomonadota bacterium]
MEPLLNPALNFFPEQVKTVHVMGICGTGVGALAGMLKERGFLVTGSDQQVYPPMSDFLASSGISVAEGYAAENLSYQPDLVIVGNVITRKNPEAIALAELQLPYVSMPQAVSHYCIQDSRSLVVTGTHGKTTTSSLLATALADAGLAPGFMIGGLVKAFGRNFNIGDGRYFVCEGDEYDTAFFDKGPKFLHYRPETAVITSIEFDHADIYADLEAIKESFRKLVAIMPENGCLVAHLDDPIVAEVVRNAGCEVAGYGKRQGVEWRLGEVDVGSECTRFSVYRREQFVGEFTSILPGVHNALNSLAVIAVLSRLGLNYEQIGKGLRSFRGVNRRQEVRGMARGVTVIDDFAHHPTAVRETLAALKEAYRGKRLIAVFEPRTNSSRRRVFQDVYPHCFAAADLVLIRDPEPLKTLGVDERFSAEKLVEDLKVNNVEAYFFKSTDTVLDYLGDNCIPGDVVAVLSNGGFDNIHTRLLDLLGN